MALQRLSPPSRTLQPLGSPEDAAGAFSLRSLTQNAQNAGLTPWIETEIAPAFKIKVRRGFEMDVKNVGTAEAPEWRITPKAGQQGAPPERKGLFGKKKAAEPATPAEPTSGFIPLALAAAKGGIMAVKAQQERLQRIDSDPWGFHPERAQGKPRKGLLALGKKKDKAAGLALNEEDGTEDNYAIGLSLEGVAGLVVPASSERDPLVAIDTDGFTVPLRGR